MKYKALVSFLGKFCMSEGEVREIGNEDAQKLLLIGYIQPFTESEVDTDGRDNDNDGAGSTDTAANTGRNGRKKAVGADDK